MARTAPCELVRLVYTMPGVAESILAIPIECISSEALKAAKLNFSPRVPAAAGPLANLSHPSRHKT